VYRSTATEEQSDRGPLVSVGTYLDVVEAELGRAKLENSGIQAVVIEPTGFNPLLTAAAGGIQLQVPEADAGRARGILALVAGDADEDDEPEGTVRCPRCELAYCFYERPSFRAAGLTNIGFFAWVLGRASAKRWHCRKCEHVWSDASAGPSQLTRLDPDDPRPVFRLRRAHGGMGLFVGLLVGALALLLLSTTSFWPLALLPPALGWLFGRTRVGWVCSEPSCRTPLSLGAEECARCKGAVAGEITRAPDHFAEAAEFRRELVALRERPQPSSGKRPRKSSERRAQAARRKASRTQSEE